MSFGTAPKAEMQSENLEKQIETEEQLPSTKVEKLTYEEAQETLGLRVETVKNDRNLIFIHGTEEGFEKIFRTLIDKLGTKQMDHEAKDNWSYVKSGNHLRPGGTYAVTLMVREEKPKMMVQNVNARNDDSINKPMHDAVEFSIIEAAKKNTTTE